MGTPRRIHLGTMLMLAMAGAANAGMSALEHLSKSAPPPTFGQRYGSNPKAINGGRRGQAAQHKRQAKRRANIRKHPRRAHQ